MSMICNYIARGEQCPYGERCRFSHDKSSMNPKLTVGGLTPSTIKKMARSLTVCTNCGRNQCRSKTCDADDTIIKNFKKNGLDLLHAESKRQLQRSQGNGAEAHTAEGKVRAAPQPRKSARGKDDGSSQRGSANANDDDDDHNTTGGPVEAANGPEQCASEAARRSQQE